MVRYYYHEWTNDEERILTDIMTTGRQQRMKVDELFVQAAAELERTKASVRNHWYKMNSDQSQAV
ncbi:hypothetical protein [Paenibacillus polymyxa]|uniref:hypothetical protein n=1 Tax=Paenibacillus polymyxa TaxID=1406 RepID=UPI00298CF0EC|nr:hypothetical protein [Paenibacillus polymyxa]